MITEEQFGREESKDFLLSVRTKNKSDLAGRGTERTLPGAPSSPLSPPPIFILFSWLFLFFYFCLGLCLWPPRRSVLASRLVFLPAGRMFEELTRRARRRRGNAAFGSAVCTDSSLLPEPTSSLTAASAFFLFHSSFAAIGRKWGGGRNSHPFSPSTLPLWLHCSS